MWQPQSRTKLCISTSLQIHFTWNKKILTLNPSSTSPDLHSKHNEKESFSDDTVHLKIIKDAFNIFFKGKSVDFLKHGNPILPSKPLAKLTISILVIFNRLQKSVKDLNSSKTIFSKRNLGASDIVNVSGPN